MGEPATEPMHICGIGNGQPWLRDDTGWKSSACLAAWIKVLLQQPRLLRDMITLLTWHTGLVTNLTRGVEMRSRVPRPSTSRSAADFDKQASFKRALFLMFFPPRLFARFPFIRPGLLGRGNDSSKTPSEESGTVSNSHRPTPGYYWIRLDSLVAPFLPT